ncbi:DNA topoisomerase III [Bacillus thuringiensis]|nr:DNA topoisomerase III [Bacillus thuringiensis]
MGYTLILAEKQNQAEAYEEVFMNTKRKKGYIEIPACPLFPNSAILTWAIGHLVTLYDPVDYDEKLKYWNLKDLPIIPSEFKFKVSNNKVEQFNTIKKLMKDASDVVIATDSDREGENITYSIIRLAGGGEKPLRRLWINSLVEKEVRKGFENLKDANQFVSYYHEAQARQVSDWLVGLNGTRLYSGLLQKKGIKGTFTVGRVQTPTLNLIYEREKEITNFKPTSFYEIEGCFEKDNQSFCAKYKEKFDSEYLLKEKLKEHNISLHSKNTAIVEEVKTEVKKVSSPKLHSLSSLQALINKKYKYSPKEVLETVQSLYDKPLTLVTYPRTDTPYITENEFEYLKEHLKEYQKIAGVDFEPYSLEPNSRYVNNKKVQEHYAIVLTEKIPTEKQISQLTDKQKNIYFEIVHSVLGMFHHPYIYEETKIDLNLQNLKFEKVGKVEVSKGWKVLFTTDHEDSKEEDERGSLPKLNRGDNCAVVLKTKEGKTKVPKRYTEGELIILMKTCGGSKVLDKLDQEEKNALKETEGLGQESTRGNIIENLKKQEYIEIKNNRTYVTKKGAILCDLVEGTMLANPKLTAGWEKYLKRIGKNEGTKENFIANTERFVQHLVTTTKEQLEEMDMSEQVEQIASQDYLALCPTCKKGHIVEKEKFYGCTNYKEGCKQTFPKEKSGKKLTKTQIKSLCEKGKTSKIKGFKGKKEFASVLVFNDGKVLFEFQCK